MKIVFSILLVCAFTGILLCACSTSAKVDNSTVERLDLEKYLGQWYELARFDHSFERGMDKCVATYTMKPDGTIRVLNQGIRKGKVKVSEGKAKVTSTPGLLRVSFWGPFYSDYRVMMIDPDYQYALVGSGSSKYLWILSRTQFLPESIRQSLLTEARRRGYDTSRLLWADFSKP